MARSNREYIFRPKIIDALKGYNRQQLYKDVIAGIIVGIVALPLAIAFGIASGVSPEKGIITAIIAGFIISALGGSRVQIGGPTGAFIVIVYGIVQSYGVGGLIIATFIAGVLLIIMGLVRLGTVIKFMPFPVIVGFTSGIAVIIFSSEIKDFFGLSIDKLPADFLGKWAVYFTSLPSTNMYTLGIGALALLIIIFWPRVTSKIPGSLIAILVTTAIVSIGKLPVETIGSRFGNISSSFPAPVLPTVNWTVIQQLIQPAITIALLAAIESLLSAVVADGMTGGDHRSNTELIAQGIANVFSSLFGGIPATGAIARTATNIKNGAKTPIAGMLHALVLLLILLFVGKWARLIPMTTLAAVLLVVAYNMSEWENFLSVMKGPRNDMVILLLTFSLTVLIDLTVAIEVGMIAAAFFFIHKMMQSSSINPVSASNRGDESETDAYSIPKEVQVFEITGPLFFGAAHKFKDVMKFIATPPRVLIIRMKNVPIIDATGIRALRELYKSTSRNGTKLILSEISSLQVREELRKSRLLFAIGKANVTQDLEQALFRANAVLNQVKTP